MTYICVPQANATATPRSTASNRRASLQITQTTAERRAHAAIARHAAYSSQCQVQPAAPLTCSATPSLVGMIAAAALVATCPAYAAADEVVEVFNRSCAGCHAGGGNVVNRSATLSLEDMQRNGISSENAVYDVTYSGRRSMPGFGKDCSPKLQCTFGPRLEDEQIKELSSFVWQQAAAGW